jgi:hypothetical protein
MHTKPMAVVQPLPLPTGNVPTLLDAYLAQVDAQPGAWCWSSNNCVHFAARWVEFATHRQVLAELANVADLRMARRVLSRLGNGTLAGAVTRVLGYPPIGALLAQVGDVVLVPGRSAASARDAGLLGCAMGICIGRYATCLGDSGQRVEVAMSLALAAWPLQGRSAAALEQAA